MGDDWLIDDVDVRGLKRKRQDMESLLKDVNVRMEKKRNRQPQPTCSGRMLETSRVRESDVRTSADNQDHSFDEQIFDCDSASPESTTVLNEEVAVNRREVSGLGAAVERRKQARLSSSGSIVTARQTSVVRNKVESRVQNVTSTTVVKPPAAPVPNPLKMRLKVRVGDQLMLVPVLERFVLLTMCVF